MTTLEIVCNAVIPTLGVLLLARAYRVWRPALLRVALVLAWSYAWHFTDRALGIWPHFGLDYSAHTGVAIAIGAALAACGTRWLAVTVTMLVFYAWCMNEVGYHPYADTLTTAAVNLPVAIAVQFVPRRRAVPAS
ncbi:MAG: hypothetical protein AAGD14_18380 [Planctomycetota bacterium]